MLRLILRLGFRNLWRNPRRSFVLVFVFSFAIWSSLALASLARGMSSRMVDNAIRTLTGHIQIHQVGYVDDPVIDNSMSPPSKELIALLGDPRLVGWMERIRVPGVIQSEREARAVTIVGIDPLRENQTDFVGKTIVEGRQLASVTDEGIVIGRKLLEDLDTSFGRRVVLLSEGADDEIGDRGYPIVGTFSADLETVEQGFVFVGIETLRKMVRLDHKISEIAITLNDIEDVEIFRSLLDDALPKELDVQSWRTLQPFVVALSEVQQSFLALWFMFIVVIVVFGLVNTQLMSTFERTREFGIMQALGMTRAHVISQILIESTLLLLIAVAIGNLLVGGTLFLLRDGIDLSTFAHGLKTFGMSTTVYPVQKSFDVTVLNFLVVIVGVVATIYPAWRITQMQITVAIADR